MVFGNTVNCKKEVIGIVGKFLTVNVVPLVRTAEFAWLR
jgi:hypothetical protein